MGQKCWRTGWQTPGGADDNDDDVGRVQNFQMEWSQSTAELGRADHKRIMTITGVSGHDCDLTLWLLSHYPAGTTECCNFFWLILAVGKFPSAEFLYSATSKSVFYYSYLAGTSVGHCEIVGGNRLHWCDVKFLHLLDFLMIFDSVSVALNICSLNFCEAKAQRELLAPTLGLCVLVLYSYFFP